MSDAPKSKEVVLAVDGAERAPVSENEARSLLRHDPELGAKAYAFDPGTKAWVPAHERWPDLDARFAGLPRQPNLRWLALAGFLLALLPWAVGDGTWVTSWGGAASQETAQWLGRMSVVVALVAVVVPRLDAASARAGRVALTLAGGMWMLAVTRLFVAMIGDAIGIIVVLIPWLLAYGVRRRLERKAGPAGRGWLAAAAALTLLAYLSSERGEMVLVALLEQMTKGEFEKFLMGFLILLPLVMAAAALFGLGPSPRRGAWTSGERRLAILRSVLLLYLPGSALLGVLVLVFTEDSVLLLAVYASVLGTLILWTLNWTAGEVPAVLAQGLREGPRAIRRELSVAAIVMVAAFVAAFPAEKSTQEFERSQRQRLRIDRASLRVATTDVTANDRGSRVARDVDLIVDGCERWFFAFSVGGKPVPPSDYFDQDWAESKSSCERGRREQMEMAAGLAKVGPCVCVRSRGLD